MFVGFLLAQVVEIVFEAFLDDFLDTFFAHVCCFILVSDCCFWQRPSPNRSFFLLFMAACLRRNQIIGRMRGPVL
jgi:hypothetical protein